MTWLVRYLVLRQARDLEAEARRLRRTFIDRIATYHGPCAGLGVLGVLTLAENFIPAEHWRWKLAAKGMRESLTSATGNERIAADLERRAAELRREAGQRARP